MSDLSQQLNKIASDKGTAGKQTTLLALAALVLLDKDNKVTFDSDDLPGTLARILNAGDVAIPSGKSIATDGEPYAGDHSYQPVGPDLNLDPAAGSTVDDPKFLAAVMGNILGESLTKEGAYLAGVIGALSILGVRASKYQIAALLGIVMDGVTDADAAVVALIDGSDPSSVTRARAAFAVAMNNNNAGSGVDYGVDLFDDATRLAGAFSGTAKPFAIAKANLRSPNEVCYLESDDVPDASVGMGFAGKGSKCVDFTHGEEYINVGTKATPDWQKMTHGAAVVSGFPFVFSSTTTAADPGTGILRINSANWNAATKMYMSRYDNHPDQDDLLTYWMGLQFGTVDGVKGRLLIRVVETGQLHILNIAGDQDANPAVVDNTMYLTFNLSQFTGNNTIPDGSNLLVWFEPRVQVP
jgi:hypothetical protein